MERAYLNFIYFSFKYISDIFKCLFQYVVAHFLYFDHMYGWNIRAELEEQGGKDKE